MMDEPETFDEIKAAVDASGGVITLAAWQLREAVGAGRLTERINGKISEELAARALGHVPIDTRDMPTNQYEHVRVYDKTTTLGKVIEAAHSPGEQHDTRLREAINEEAANLLEQIRSLVAE
jgi:hypothetical protein